MKLRKIIGIIGIIGIILVSIVIILGIFFLFLQEFLIKLELLDDKKMQICIDDLEQYIKFLQVLLVGVFVAIIPSIISEERNRFEKYKESRLAYSKAKTAVLYLPDRVVNVENRKKAFLLIEEAHRELHFAETFKDLIISEGYLKWFDNPKLWIIYNYWQIVAVAEVLRKVNIDWSAIEDKRQLRKFLDYTLNIVHKRFGRTGESCQGEIWINEKYFEPFKNCVSKYRFYKRKWEIKVISGFWNKILRFRYRSRSAEEAELEIAIKNIITQGKRILNLSNEIINILRI